MKGPNRQICRDGKWMHGRQGPGDGRNREQLAGGPGASGGAGGDEMFCS